MSARPAPTFNAAMFGLLSGVLVFCCILPILVPPRLHTWDSFLESEGVVVYYNTEELWLLQGEGEQFFGGIGNRREGGVDAFNDLFSSVLLLRPRNKDVFMPKVLFYSALHIYSWLIDPLDKCCKVLVYCNIYREIQLGEICHRILLVTSNKDNQLFFPSLSLRLLLS